MSTVTEAATHAMQCPMCQRGQPCEAAAVDATLDVTAELARVTAERDGLKAALELLKSPTAVRVNILRGHIAKPWPEPHEVEAELVARAEQAEAEIERLKAIIADQARDESGRVSMPLVAHDKIDAARKERDAALARAEKAEAERDVFKAKLDETDRRWAFWSSAIAEVKALQARAEKAEKALLDVHDALHAECNGAPDLPAEIRTLRAERDELAAKFSEHNTQTEALKKATATLRGLAERARECLASTSHHEECGRSDECEDADPGDCGEHGSGGCPACDCGASEWHETAAELHAALKEKNT